MIKECGQFNWFVDDEGNVYFYKLGKNQKKMTKAQLITWVKRLGVR